MRKSPSNRSAWLSYRTTSSAEDVDTGTDEGVDEDEEDYGGEYCTQRPLGLSQRSVWIEITTEYLDWDRYSTKVIRTPGSNSVQTSGIFWLGLIFQKQTAGSHSVHNNGIMT